MQITLRNTTLNKVAFSAWLLVDGTLQVSKVSQRAYDDFAVVDGGVGDAPGRPAVDATFLMAAGGIPALDTATEWPDIGDAFVDRSNLIIATHEDPPWSYRLATADVPVGGFSNLRGAVHQAVGHRLIVPLTSIDLAALPTLTIAPGLPTVISRIAITLPSESIKRETIVIDERIENHRSVTFDAFSSGAVNNATSLTVSHTTTTQTNRYIAATAVSDSGVVSTVTYAAITCTSRLTVTTGPQINYRDLVAPATGANNIVFTMDASTPIVGGGQTAYTVDQTTPRSNTNTANGTSTSAALTVTSAIGELVLTIMGTDFNPAVTPDATWTLDWNVINAGTDIREVAMHKVGAASVTRTDALSPSAAWVLVGASLKEAAAKSKPRLQPRWRFVRRR